MGATSCKCHAREKDDAVQDVPMPGIDADNSDIIDHSVTEKELESGSRRISFTAADRPESIVERMLQRVEEGDADSIRGMLSEFGPGIVPLELRRLLQKAIACDQLEVAELLLGNGFPVDSVDDEGDVMLHVVAVQNKLGAASLLLKSRADVERQNAEGTSPLLLAAENGHTEMAKLLMDQGASREALDAQLVESFQMCDCEQARTLLQCGASIETKSGDYTPLLIAADRGELPLVKLCVEQNADINIKSASGQSALSIATEKGLVQMASFLIESGADPLVKASDGNNALLVAAKSGNLKMMQLFARRKGSLEPLDKEALGKQLLAAIEKGNIDAVKALLLCGVSTKTKKSDGRSALVFAIEKKQTAIAKVLAAKGVEKKDKDALGKKLVDSTLKDDLETMKLLLSFKASTEAKTTDGRSALIVATEGGNSQAVRALISAGARKDAKTKDGRTPLLIAVEKANHELTDILIDAGARATGEGLVKLNKNLLEAADKGDAVLAKLMLRCGASVDAKDIHSETALHKAAGMGRLDVAKILLDAGASIEPRGGEYGTTPLFYAANNKRLDVAKLLIEQGANKEGSDPEGGEKYEALLESSQAKASNVKKSGRRISGV